MVRGYKLERGDGGVLWRGSYWPSYGALGPGKTEDRRLEGSFVGAGISVRNVP